MGENHFHSTYTAVFRPAAKFAVRIACNIRGFGCWLLLIVLMFVYLDHVLSLNTCCFVKGYDKSWVDALSLTHSLNWGGEMSQYQVDRYCG